MFTRKQLEDVEPDVLRELLHDVVDRLMPMPILIDFHVLFPPGIG